MTDHDDMLQMLQADPVAADDHNQADASRVHALLAVRIWRALRTLGAGHGRMLVTGVDPDIFARLPLERVQTWIDDSAGVLWADIPQEGIRSAPTGYPDAATDTNAVPGRAGRWPCSTS